MAEINLFWGALSISTDPTNHSPSPTSSPPKAGSRSSGHSQQPQQQVGNPFLDFITNSFKELQGNTPTDQLRPNIQDNRNLNSFNNEPVVHDKNRGIIGNSNGRYKGGVVAFGQRANNALKQIADQNDVQRGNIEKPEPKVNVSEDDRKAYWFSQLFSDFIPVPKDDLNTTAPVAFTSRNQTENGFVWGGDRYSTTRDSKGNVTGHDKQDSFFTRLFTSAGLFRDKSGSDVSPSGEKTTASDRYRHNSQLGSQYPSLPNHLNSLGNSQEENTSVKPKGANSSSGDSISSQSTKTLWTERASSIHSSDGRTNSNGGGDRTSVTSRRNGGGGGGRTSVTSRRNGSGLTNSNGEGPSTQWDAMGRSDNRGRGR